jgi:hypothetical protein
MNPRAGLDAMKKRKSYTCRELNPGNPAHTIPALRKKELNK